MDKSLEKKEEKCILYVSYIKSKSPKESINCNVSKPAETRDISTVSVCIQALWFCNVFFR
jgi:hypothetical protein